VSDRDAVDTVIPEGLGRAIDLHAHYLPDVYRAALRESGIEHPDGVRVGVPDWREESHLELLDRVGIGTAVLSLSTPGALLSDDTAAARQLAQRVNDAGAELVARRPQRFGLFASLPLPDLDAALDETGRAFESLGADGISLLTNYHGRYLGDESFEPLMDELDHRGAVVAIHPTSPACHEAVSFGRTRALVEFMFDTARAVVNLVLSGSVERHRRISWVVPHGGGVLPLLVERVQRHVDGHLLGDEQQPVEVEATLGRFTYDLAGGALPRQLPTLLTLVDSRQIVYGSDYPFTRPALVESFAAALVEAELLGRAELKAVLRENALRLLPRLAAREASAGRAAITAKEHA